MLDEAQMRMMSSIVDEIGNIKETESVSESVAAAFDEILDCIVSICDKQLEINSKPRQIVNARASVVLGRLIAGQFIAEVKRLAFMSRVDADIQDLGGGLVDKTLAIHASGPPEDVQKFMQWVNDTIELNGGTSY